MARDAGPDDDDDAVNEDTSKSYDDGYNKGLEDGAFGDRYNDDNYAQDEDDYRDGYSQGYEDGQSKDELPGR